MTLYVEAEDQSIEIQRYLWKVSYDVLHMELLKTFQLAQWMMIASAIRSYAHLADNFLLIAYIMTHGNTGKYWEIRESLIFEGFKYQHVPMVSIKMSVVMWYGQHQNEYLNKKLKSHNINFICTSQ